MLGKDEYRVSLYEFSPYKFYQWLNDEGFDNLSYQSEQAIRLLIRDYPGYNNEKVDLKSIINILEFEKLLNALTIDDFMNYLEWVLYNIPGLPYTPSIEELMCTPDELRHRLLIAFSSKRILPSMDYSTLLRNALEAIDAVCNALREYGPATCSFYQVNLRKSIHEGMDKIFLYAENFVALLLEFLVLTAEQNNIINELEKEELLFLKRDYKSDWGEKQQSIWDICVKVMQNDCVDDLDKELYDVYAISCPPCLAKKKKKALTNIVNPGPLGIIIDKLRKQRNEARHTQLQGDYTIPESYQDIAFKEKELLEETWEIISNYSFPMVMRMVGYSENYYGKFEAYYISKDAKTITIRFINRGELIRTSPTDFLVFTEDEPEFFVYPRPQLGQLTIVDPIVVKRLFPAYEVQTVYLKLDSVDDFNKSTYAVV